MRLFMFYIYYNNEKARFIRPGVNFIMVQNIQ